MCPKCLAEGVSLRASRRAHAVEGDKMEPRDSEVKWNPQMMMKQGAPDRRRALWTRKIKIARVFALLVAFAAGFTTRGLLTLHPQGVAQTPTANDTSMIARSDGNLSTNSTASLDNTIVVDVHGDVLHPGVYQLPISARVQDAVKAAGGLRHQQDVTQVNLAAALTDGQEVVIPKISNATQPVNSADGPTGLKVTNSAPPPNSVAVGGIQGTNPIDLNTADAETLETLPGIGPGRAQAIIAYRQQHGPFASIKDIQNVKGIGPSIFEHIQSYLFITK